MNTHNRGIRRILGRGMVAALVLLAIPGRTRGQEPAANRHDVAGLKGLKVTETAHYRLYYSGKSPSKFGTLIEKVCEDAAKVMPRLSAVFQTGDLGAEPGPAPTNTLKQARTHAAPHAQRKSGSKKEKEKEEEASDTFKLTLVFVEQRADFEAAARSLLPADLEDDARKAAETAIRAVPTLATPDGLTRVYWMDDPNMKSRGYDTFVSHCNTTDLTALHQGESKVPFWVTAGLGYYMEFKFFDKSVTAYLDYEKYYSELDPTPKEGKLVTKETLAIGQPWAPILKRMMQKGVKKGNLRAVLTAQTESLTPETCGYTYAFVWFLLSDAKKCQMFGDFLMRLRENKGQDMEKQLLEAYGFENVDAMQKEWYAFMLSNRFR